jgi:hypothetical protein
MALRHTVPNPAYNDAYCEDKKSVSDDAAPNEAFATRESSLMEIDERDTMWREAVVA